MKKIFVIADIHGCYDYTIEALNKAGYDENNTNNLLVVLGDIFDRSNQNIEIFEWLYKLTNSGKAIVTSGNHHKFFIDFLEGSYNPFNYLHNGLRETIADFWHRTAPFESWCMLEGNCEMNQESYVKWVDICRKDIMEEYPDLLPWLKSLPRYFESKNYIGVHGAIDTNAPDWHYPHCYRYNLRDWDALDFDDGSFFGKEILNTGKNIIIGHFGTQALREMYNIDKDNKNQFAPLLSKNGRILAIDATTNYSHQVNVAVIEDDLL